MISPLDERYYPAVKELENFFSDFALTKFRLQVEVEYFIALSENRGVGELKPFSTKERNELRSLYTKFIQAHYLKIKEIEGETAHDVKAIEYFLKNKLPTQLKKYEEFIHFALTSEDINSIAWALAWQQALEQSFLPHLKNVLQTLQSLAKKHAHTPLLAMTHGQSASPTTFGKEISVYWARLLRQYKQLEKISMPAKFSGATGNWNAHMIAYPAVDWLIFSKKFITSFGLTPNLLTTQIEPHDTVAEVCNTVALINTILIDFCRDIWLYNSRGILKQIPKAKEIGSSTMPHKVNPIQFENAEGNLGLANALLRHFSDKLPISRLQRDLSDSTVMRSSGVPFAHSILAYQNIITGLGKLTLNEVQTTKELNEHWEVLAEAIQIILRKEGQTGAYELIKEATRGKTFDQVAYQALLKQLPLSSSSYKKLSLLTPATYLGLSTRLV